MDYPVDFVLIRHGEGVIECSNEDVFSEDYIKKMYKTPGKYGVMQRKDMGDYRTTKKLRDIELVEYAAPDKKDEPMSSTPSSSLLEEKFQEFEKNRAAGWPVKKPEPGPLPGPTPTPLTPSPSPGDEWKIVRKAGTDQLKVVDKSGNPVLDGFTFDDLKSAKQHYSGTDQVVKKDLKDQSFLKFVVVFLGGLLVGALGTFIVLNQKHQQELASLHGKLDTMQRQIQQQMASPRKRDFNSMLLEDYNQHLGGPV